MRKKLRIVFAAERAGLSSAFTAQPATGARGDPLAGGFGRGACRGSATGL